MPLNLQVHRYARMPGTNETRLVSSNPYLRLNAGPLESPPLFVQQGRVYSEGGELIKDLPEWFWEEARKCSPEARREVGLVLPEEGPINTPEPEPPPPPAVSAQPPKPPSTPMNKEELFEYLGIEEPKPDEGEDQGLLAPPTESVHSVQPATWSCPDCGEEIAPKVKGVHIARHRRNAMGMK